MPKYIAIYQEASDSFDGEVTVEGEVYAGEEEDQVYHHFQGVGYQTLVLSEKQAQDLVKRLQTALARPAFERVNILSTSLEEKHKVYEELDKLYHQGKPITTNEHPSGFPDESTADTGLTKKALWGM